MKKMIECGLKHSFIMAAMLAAILFATGCGGGPDDPSKKTINEGQDKTGTGQTDSSGSGSSDNTSGGENGDNTGTVDPGTGQTNPDPTPDPTPADPDVEVTIKVISIGSSVATHEEVSYYNGAGKDEKVMVKESVKKAGGAGLLTAITTALKTEVVKAGKAGPGDYKFFKEATGGEPDADTNLAKIYIGKEKEVDITVTVKTITDKSANNDYGEHKAYGKVDHYDNSGNGQSETVKVKKALSDAATTDEGKTALLAKVLEKLPALVSDPSKGGAGDYKFFKEATGTNAPDKNAVTSTTTITVFVGKKFTVKAKVTIAPITAGQTFTDNSNITGKTIVVPASSGAFVAPFIGQHEATKAAFFADSEVTKEALKKVIEDALTAASLADGTSSGNVKFFLSPTPQATDNVLDLANLTPSAIQDKTIYVGTFN